MLKLSKKIALPLIAVLLIGTGVGGYFLFRNFQLPKYFVDKYPELLEYCDTMEDANGLRVSCKALILDIKPNVSEGVPSLTSLIITKDEELNEYTIAEEEAKFAFTNDILQFKKLKPVIINIQYTKINPIKYAVQDITFDDIPETYIQEIVNRDIEEIMGMDKSSTTILNSFDFCPRPEILPDYVTEKNKTEYSEFLSINMLDKDEYSNPYLYNWDDSTIRILFACDSAGNMEYTNVCDKNKLRGQDLLSNNIPRLTAIPNWNQKEMDNNDQSLLKEISLIYDSMFLKYQHSNIVNLKLFKDLVNNINNQGSVNEEVFCSMYSIYVSLNKISQVWIIDKKYLYDTIISNIEKSRSISCNKIISESENINEEGLFIKNAILNNTNIYSSCLNLNIFVNKNE